MPLCRCRRGERGEWRLNIYSTSNSIGAEKGFVRNNEHSSPRGSNMFGALRASGEHSAALNGWLPRRAAKPKTISRSRAATLRQWMHGRGRIYLPSGGRRGVVEVEANSFVDPNEDDGLELDRLVDSSGMLSVVGFGSLLSTRSCLSTFGAVKVLLHEHHEPTDRATAHTATAESMLVPLQCFRPGRLHGYRRVFAHSAPIFIRRGIANLETKERSSLSVEPCEGESIVVSLFEMSAEEIGSFIEREHEFRFRAVQTEEMDGSMSSKLSVVCSRFTDEEYRYM